MTWFGDWIGDWEGEWDGLETATPTPSPIPIPSVLKLVQIGQPILDLSITADVIDCSLASTILSGANISDVISTLRATWLQIRTKCVGDVMPIYGAEVTDSSNTTSVEDIDQQKTDVTDVGLSAEIITSERSK